MCGLGVIIIVIVAFVTLVTLFECSQSRNYSNKFGLFEYTSQNGLGDKYYKILQRNVWGFWKPVALSCDDNINPLTGFGLGGAFSYTFPTKEEALKNLDIYLKNCGKTRNDIILKDFTINS